MRFAFIDAWKEVWPVEFLCRIMQVTSRGFRESTNPLRCGNDPNIGGLSHSVNVVAHHYRTHTGASLF
jgi:hypothetical protein